MRRDAARCRSRIFLQRNFARHFVLFCTEAQMRNAHPKTDMPGIEVQVEQFPAPLCDRCGVPKWLIKRVSYAGPPYSQLRLGFRCLTCGSRTELCNQEPIALVR
jgi:hypothetical protein